MGENSPNLVTLLPTSGKSSSRTENNINLKKTRILLPEKEQNHVRQARPTDALISVIIVRV
jgi:hypothetical protein